VQSYCISSNKLFLNKSQQTVALPCDHDKTKEGKRTIEDKREGVVMTSKKE
jgi:hypothetical protein